MQNVERLTLNASLRTLTSGGNKIDSNYSKPPRKNKEPQRHTEPEEAIAF